MAKGIITMCEVGVLLDKNHSEFDFYSNSWNHEYGFYNENNILYQSKLGIIQMQELQYFVEQT